MAETLSVIPYPVVGAMDKRINAPASQNQVYVAEKGASVVTQKNYTTTSYSNSSFQFSCPPPNDKIFVDRLVKIKVYFSVTTDVDITNGLGSNIGLRQYPFNSVIETVNCTLNNNQVSVITGDIIHPLMRYHNSKSREDKVLSTTAAFPDQFQSYEQWANPQFGGSARNPFAAYGEQLIQNRGAIRPYNITNSNKTFYYVVEEPLFLLSPWLWDEHQHLGFTNLKSLDFNFNLKSNLARLFCTSSLQSPQPASITVNFSSTGSFPVPSPELHFQFLTPPLTMRIPNSISYPYYPIERYVTGSLPVSAGASSQLIGNNIQLNQIPKRIYVYIRTQNSDLFGSTPWVYSDSFAVITNLNIQFNNLSGILATYSQEDLYEMCRRNGIDMSYKQFSDYVGSVIAIDPSSDLGLSDIQANGLLGQYNLQIQANFTNNSPNNLTYSMFIVVINEGVLEIGPTVIAQTGILSKVAILDSQNIPQVDVDMIKYDSEMGGNVFGKLKQFVNVASKAAEQVGKVGKAYNPELAVLESIGKVGKELTGGKRYRKTSNGKGLFGA